MAERQPRLRSRAASDIDEAIAYLRSDAGDARALAFIGALEVGINHIARSPNAGSLRFAFELGIPELRGLGLKRFPYVVFYMSHDDHVDIWRVLHTRRDVPGVFARGDGSRPQL